VSFTKIFLVVAEMGLPLTTYPKFAPSYNVLIIVYNLRDGIIVTQKRLPVLYQRVKFCELWPTFHRSMDCCCIVKKFLSGSHISKSQVFTGNVNNF